MKVITVVPETGGLRLAERPAPALALPHDVKLEVVRVGVCGTDREEARGGGRARAPDGGGDLVIGHEMLGRVVEVGPAVRRLRPGDHAVLTVRRGCGRCEPCAFGRADMCRTGEYRERGIWGLDGYQAEHVVEREIHAVPVPAELAAVAVLAEPLSIVEKAIEEAVRLEAARLPGTAGREDWLTDRPCLVAGLGPVGLLAAMVLRLRGAAVYGLDVVDAGTARPRWLEQIGGRYVDGRAAPAAALQARLGPLDLVVEATGNAAIALELIDALAPGGALVLTGVPGGTGSLAIPGADLVRQLVLGNRLVLGSVNASREHFQLAVADLVAAARRWSDHVAGLITHRYPAAEYGAALGTHAADEIKAVIEWAPGRG